MLTKIFLILGIVCTTVFLIRRDENSSLSAVILKICSSMLFVATAAAGLYESAGGNLRYGLLILMGLVLGMLGDIWLDLKWIYPKDKRYFMYGGFLFFLFGHLCFSAGVVFGSDMPTPEALRCLIVPAIVGVAFPFVSKLFIDLTGFRCITSLYTFSIALTATTSATALMLQVGTWQLLMVIGAVLFFCSDFILCNTYFGNRMTSRVFVVINHLLYYAAQFCIAMSVFYKP